MGIDHYDIVAMILGVMLMVRRLDVRSREATDFAHVPADQFEFWRRKAAFAYTLGSLACFVRVLFHFGFARYAAAHALPQLTYMRTALVVDLLWGSALIACFVLARSANQLRRKLGIVLQPGPNTRR